MMNDTTTNKYVPTIGIECHVQLRTATKLFAAVENDARYAAPNTLISHICLGMPGALPVLNREAIHLASRAAFALGTRPQKFSKFDRKHYFYPDLPKGYQITQFDQPIIMDGFVDISVSSGTKRIHVERAHLEEDAGKSTHPEGKNYSLVDLNRAGTPLLEIVSGPDMHSAEEAKAYAQALWLLIRYADVSDADLYHGNMRFDVNVSVSADSEVLGTRTETKNLNSFRSVEKAVEYEIKRQIELLEKGEAIVQETRGWDDAKQKTFSQRTKEDAHDYRYFPDPDIPPVVLSEEWIDSIAAEMPVMPGIIRDKLSHVGLDASVIDTILDILPAGRFMLSLADSNTRPEFIKKIANWLVSDVQAMVAEGSVTWEEITLEIEPLLTLAELTATNKISSTGAKIVLQELVIRGGDVMTIATEKNVLQISDEAEIVAIVKQVIDANPKPVQDVLSGEMKAIGFLVGQVMKQSQGKANPSVASDLIKKQLGI